MIIQLKKKAYGDNSRLSASREVILRITVSHPDKRAIFFFGKEVAPVATSMAPGVCGGSERPSPSEVIEHFSFLVRKDRVENKLKVANKEISFVVQDCQTNPNLIKEVQLIDSPNFPETPLPRTNILRSPLIDKFSLESNLMTVPLIKLCWGRSGDKGDSANIGIICRDARFFPFVERCLTEESVALYFKHLLKGKVVRYLLPSSFSFNFLLTKSLGGGGLSSLQIDKQGKTYAQNLLSFPIQIPSELFLHSPHLSHGKL